MSKPTEIFLICIADYDNYEPESSWSTRELAEEELERLRKLYGKNTWHFIHPLLLDADKEQRKKYDKERNKK